MNNNNQENKKVKKIKKKIKSNKTLKEVNFIEDFEDKWGRDENKEYKHLSIFDNGQTELSEGEVVEIEVVDYNEEDEVINRFSFNITEDDRKGIEKQLEGKKSLKKLSSKSKSNKSVKVHPTIKSKIKPILKNRYKTTSENKMKNVKKIKKKRKIRKSRKKPVLVHRPKLPPNSKSFQSTIGNNNSVKENQKIKEQPFTPNSQEYDHETIYHPDDDRYVSKQKISRPTSKIKLIK